MPCKYEDVNKFKEGFWRRTRQTLWSRPCRC
ncbi:hypothetical protein ACTQ2R_13590 [Hallella faecis]